MKGKITDSLKPPLTRRPFEVGYWKLNEMPGGGVWLRQKHQFLRKKQYERTTAKLVEESIKSMKSRKQKGSYSKCVHMRSEGKGVESSIIRYVRDKWMPSNKCFGIFFVHWSGFLEHHRQQGKCLFSSIIITIILSYARIIIYTILNIYLQVSKTEGMAELH